MDTNEYRDWMQAAAGVGEGPQHLTTYVLVMGVVALLVALLG